MNEFLKLISLSIVTFLLGATLSAAAVPTELSYMGRILDDSGKPAIGPIDLEVSFYASPSEGIPLAEKTYKFSQVSLSKGVFQVNIKVAAADLNKIFGDSASVYIQVTDVTSNKIFDRQKYNAVPFALKVPTDDTSIEFDADGKLAVSKLKHILFKNSNDAVVTLKPSESSVDGTTFTLPAAPAAGMFMTTDADGNLGWAAPAGSGDITGVSAGTGLTGGAANGDATLNVDVGTTTGKIVQVATGNKLPAIDGSALTNVSAPNLAGTLPNNVFPATLPVSSAANLTNIPAANITGTLPPLSGASLTDVPAGVLTGTLPTGVFPATLPASSAANLTNIPAGNLTGVLPALSAANLTNIPAGNITGTFPALSGANITNINGSNISSGTVSSSLLDVGVTTGKIVQVGIFDRLPAVDASNLTNLTASNLAGTLPTAVFPATLPAVSAANLTNIPAANLTGTLPTLNGANITDIAAANITGTLPSAVFPATLPAASAANLTSIPAANITGTLPALSGANLTNIPAANLTGTLPSGVFPATLPAASAANLTSIPAANITGALPAINGGSLTGLNGTNITTGTVSNARLDIGTGNNQLVALNGSAELPAVSGANLTNIPAANITGTLPALSGANITNIPAANLTGTLPTGVFPATLPVASAANLTSIPAANVTGTLPAITGANLTNLNGTNISSGTVANARLNVGTGNNQLVALNGSAELPAVSGANLTNLNPAALSSAVAIDKGGTGSITQNFVDLTTAQTVAGNKTFSNNISIGGQAAFPSQSLTLANGSNDDFAIGNGVNYLITGPSAAFTLTGMAGGANGRTVILINTTSQIMTIANQSGSSTTAANRIVTMNGANITVGGGGSMQLIYDSTASRWRTVMVPYEEGSFTPTYSGTTITGSCTYTLQSGTYVRIGKVVHYNITMAWTACGTAPTGSPQIGNLPYASLSTANVVQSAELLTNGTYTAGGATSVIYGQIQPNTQTIRILTATTANPPVFAAAAVDAAVTSISATGSYIIN